MEECGKRRHKYMCGIDVEKAARVLALINIIGSTADIAARIYFYGPTPFSGLVLLVQTFYIAIAALIFVAQKYGKPRLYLPYLIVQGITTLAMGIVTVGAVGWSIYYFFAVSRDKGLWMMAISAIMLAIYPILIWLYRVVWLAYRACKVGKNDEDKGKLLNQDGILE